MPEIIIRIIEAAPATLVKIRTTGVATSPKVLNLPAGENAPLISNA
jgi:hypothetical protein